MRECNSLSATISQHLDAIAPGSHLVTIGTFDGVHRGHQFLLDQAHQRAGELGLPLLVVTFEPVPSQVLRPDRFPGRIATPERKLQLLAAAGPDEIAILPFTHEFSRQTPEEFMGRLVAAAHPREIWIGEGFALGRDRTGSIERLRTIGDELGYSLMAVPRLEDALGIISSSAIRAALDAGDVAIAMDKLGRPFQIAGEVLRGAQIGRKIGFPTANVRPPAELVALPDGIYATYTVVPGRCERLPSMTYIGTRPALNTGERLIEAHILDFAGDLYGHTIAVEFLEHLRGDASFPNVEALIEQLRADEAATRAFLATTVGALT
jgi:riboflavin kinase/FMN adenylyltransferase